MRLRARVRVATGNTRHIVNGALAPVPAYVEIAPAGGAFYLLYFDANGRNTTDTWHETIDAAKAQAQFEFLLDDADWEPVDD
ncbi:MAG: hypothetical protein H0T46_02660 [Deltaproteobacteria bacterium]|nr:hypothetical protein [Deltaproteobacteria bacterium]